jgi:hypothetical protein
VTDVEECVFRNIRRPGQRTLAGCGGYGPVEIEAVLFDLKEAGIELAARERVVCRVVAKDRVLLHYDPHEVLEGISLVARALGKSDAVISIETDLGDTRAILEAALAEAPFPIAPGEGAAVADAETFAAVPHICRKSAAWYRGLGFGRENGTKIWTVEGRGQFELPRGITVAELLTKYARAPVAPVRIDGKPATPDTILGGAWTRGEGVVAL